ncbi:MAG: hypothetical protein JXA69_17960 [Phycisphaerae bacterium]|nr:hypothetical protein [Phycisphaerae bacterium]
MDAGSQGTRLNRFWNWVHNNRILVVVLVLVTIVIGLAQLTDAVNKLRQFVSAPDSAAKAEYCELLVPLIVQLDRTKAAFDRWTEKNLSLESEIIREGNKEARHILMNKAHLIPAKLENDARRLIEHYDRWFEEFDRIRVRHADSNEPFVFVGPAGFPFPDDAGERFRQRAAELKDVLGTENPCR